MGGKRVGANEPTKWAALCAPRRDVRDELFDQLERGLREGARVLAGGTRPEGEGAFLAPTVVDGVEPDGVLAQEETFGPVAAILRAADDMHAIEIANRSPYG